MADPKFTAFHEQIKPGLAQFMRDAIHAYCDKLDGKYHEGRKLRLPAFVVVCGRSLAVTEQ